MGARGGGVCFKFPEATKVLFVVVQLILCLKGISDTTVISEDIP